MIKDKRLSVSGGDEIAKLAISFNTMAEAIEEKIDELSKNARQKEEFVANFAHELKTPLTSVIGYADMIFQKNLPDSKRESQFEFHCDYIRVDYDLLKTLLLNLIDNSVKAGSTKIKISGKCKGKRYCICVEDNGRGIPANEIDRITEAFYMVDKSRSHKQHSAGLGLALAQKVAEIHGTTLKIASVEQKGTSVELNLLCKEDGNK